MTEHIGSLKEIKAAARLYRYRAVCSCGWSAKFSTEQQSNAQQQLDSHLKKASCPTPDKLSFSTRTKAYQRINGAWTHGRNITLPSQAYHCRCGSWHMTSGRT